MRHVARSRCMLQACRKTHSAQPQGKRGQTLCARWDCVARFAVGVRRVGDTVPALQHAAPPPQQGRAPTRHARPANGCDQCKLHCVKCVAWRVARGAWRVARGVRWHQDACCAQPSHREREGTLCTAWDCVARVAAGIRRAGRYLLCRSRCLRRTRRLCRSVGCRVAYHETRHVPRHRLQRTKSKRTVA
jgi:hypothetical protein